MVKNTEEMLEQLYARYPALDICKNEIASAIQLIIDCHNAGKKVLVCGNGGSASDAEHIVGELMKGFLLPRKLPDDTKDELYEMFPEHAKYLYGTLQESISAISLVSQTSLMTAFSNDQGADCAFAQQVYGYGKPGDVLIAISTSGNSKNVVHAVQVAKLRKMCVILLSGETGGALKSLCDINICAPANETYKIQEYHLPIYHCICACAENELFGEE